MVAVGSGVAVEGGMVGGGGGAAVGLAGEARQATVRNRIIGMRIFILGIHLLWHAGGLKSSGEGYKKVRTQGHASQSAIAQHYGTTQISASFVKG